MFAKYEIKGDQFELARLITRLEASRWPGVNESDFTRLVGTLGEMAACIYLDASSGKASTVPMGLVHRMGLVSDHTLGHGDVVVIGKRIAARGRHNIPVEMAYSNAHEVKATTARPLRGMVKADAVAQYYDQKVKTILLFFIRLFEDRAFCILDSMAAPASILSSWELVDYHGTPHYIDPNIRRKQMHEAAAAAQAEG